MADNAGNDKGCGCGNGQEKVTKNENSCAMPEVTFPALVMSFNTSALYHLGEIADPETGKKIIDLCLARHAIDTLVVMQEKTKGNLTSDEEEMLKNIIYDIKLRFVNASK
ncbi:MAG: hypothetical protein COA36_01240 [Desulfotalea sp.]|nr:MAG: hypothetical protein COA36_01240 [Desulfotalea sp.]